MGAPNPKTNSDCVATRHGSIVAGRDGCICPEVEVQRERKRERHRANDVTRAALVYDPAEVEWFWSLVSEPNEVGCRVWLGEKNNQGYGVFCVRRLGYRVKRLTHRVAFQLASGAAEPAGRVVRHGCDNPPCCAPDHLSIGTQRDNMRDALDRGRRNLDGLRAGWDRCGRYDETRALETRGLRRCRMCDEVKQIEDFTFANRAAGKRKCYCGPCDRAKQADGRRRRNTEPALTPEERDRARAARRREAVAA